jgi:hypothetical protein
MRSPWGKSCIQLSYFCGRMRCKSHTHSFKLTSFILGLATLLEIDEDLRKMIHVLTI